MGIPPLERPRSSAGGCLSPPPVAGHPSTDCEQDLRHLLPREMPFMVLVLVGTGGGRCTWPTSAPREPPKPPSRGRDHRAPRRWRVWPSMRGPVNPEPTQRRRTWGLRRRDGRCLWFETTRGVEPIDAGGARDSACDHPPDRMLGRARQAEPMRPPPDEADEAVLAHGQFTEGCTAGPPVVVRPGSQPREVTGIPNLLQAIRLEAVSVTGRGASNHQPPQRRMVADAEGGRQVPPHKFGRDGVTGVST